MKIFLHTPSLAHMRTEAKTSVTKQRTREPSVQTGSSAHNAYTRIVCSQQLLFCNPQWGEMYIYGTSFYFHPSEADLIWWYVTDVVKRAQGSVLVSIKMCVSSWQRSPRWILQAEGGKEAGSDVGNRSCGMRGRKCWFHDCFVRWPWKLNEPVSLRAFSALFVTSREHLRLCCECGLFGRSMIWIHSQE